MKTETTFILIDDNLVDFMIHKIIFQNEFETPSITHFKNGELALKYIEENYTTETTYKTIILLDLEMPVMGGEEFLKKNCKLDMLITAQLKIVVISATINRKIINRVWANPYVYRFIAKPLQKEKVSQLILEITNNHSEEILVMKAHK